MSETVKFFDIIEPRRKAGDTFRYLTKYWYPKKTFTVQRYYSPQDLKIAVLNSSYIDAVLEAESIRTGIQKEKLKQEIACYLEEMGLDKKLYVIRWLGIIFLKITLMMKVRVFVNEGAVLQLKQIMGANPVLFLPTHRSYADFCLMTYLCFHYDIEFPAVAAGMVGLGCRKVSPSFGVTLPSNRMTRIQTSIQKVDDGEVAEAASPSMISTAPAFDLSTQFIEIREKDH
ncbi:Dihydroxyacetone phosphate acyltransferase [Eumeta japonica]|uniref:Dihydroxyacetone phosphate acyltransferase n=1 Tax=Eumeta variegata TaxID=151549 RepID=A0A4C1VED4_EUMVA|nr:Dihydroxyacetone phosphate acyltransferase [Eumeta japonica]